MTLLGRGHHLKRENGRNLSREERKKRHKAFDDRTTKLKEENTLDNIDSFGDGCV